MIEKTLLDYLTEELAPIPVYLETPEQIPEKYYLIEKTGSGETNYIRRATFALQSISSNSLYEAAQMNEELKAAMSAIIYSEDISKAALNSDYHFTNTATKQYRYQAVYDLIY